jgi:hypothetical protein
VGWRFLIFKMEKRSRDHFKLYKIALEFFSGNDGDRNDQEKLFRILKRNPKDFHCQLKMNVRKESLIAPAILVASFAGFYSVAESLFWSRVPIFSVGALTLVVIVVISFLNLIPAGIFAFTLVSMLPRSLQSRYNEKELVASSDLRLVPRIAVLYTTYNDFMGDHARYDFEEAKRGSIPFFILDDSSSPLYRRHVDSFSVENDCPVVRRSSRKGFKAGAVNEWITRFGGDFDYFFILDSDSRASLGAIMRCVEVATSDPLLAVVQSKTLTMTSNPTRLTCSAVTIQHAYMEIVQKAMRNLGTSPYYGHNALIKTDAVKSVGGLVEESNEDYKTLSLMHRAGFKSIYAESAITWEEVPVDYLSSKKRSLRWSRDAVSQLALIRKRNPVAIGFYLLYGWITHMSNLLLVCLMSVLTLFAFPHLFGSSLTEAAGALTVSVIVLWPLSAVRIKDNELTARKMGSALFWGSVYNIPMMAPVAFQITKTVFLRVWKRFASLLSLETRVVEEFIVTPKTSVQSRSLRSVLSKLRPEVTWVLVMIFIVFASRQMLALIYASPLILSTLSLPFLVHAESKNVTPKPLEETPLLRTTRWTISETSNQAMMILPTQVRWF